MHFLVRSLGFAVACLAGLFALAAPVSASALSPLPAAYQGTLPCASCAGIEYTLVLHSDQSYRLRMVYQGVPGNNRFDDLGRWVMSAHGNLLVLQGQAGDRMYFRVRSPDLLTLQDLEGRDIVSTLNYTLQRTEPLPTLVLKLYPLKGMYMTLADAGLLEECASGLRYPVQQAADNARLETVYLKARTAVGQPLMVSLYAQLGLVPAAEAGASSREGIVPLRFEEVLPGAVCPPRLEALPLQNTPWTLFELNGKPVAMPESRRPPGLRLDEESGRLSASGGCNQMVGSYKVDGKSLTMSALAATRMACLHSGDVEYELAQAMQNTRHWNVLGDRLQLEDALGRVLARFNRQPD
ncbi:MAG TPA: META domain-containing protein [Limnobacter sp.]|nr:META domain-containing protein [Limnobacter sp.]